MSQTSGIINRAVQRTLRWLGTLVIASTCGHQLATTTMAQQPPLEIPGQIKSLLSLVELGESGGFTFSNTSDPKESERQRSELFGWFNKAWPQLVKSYSEVVPGRKEQIAWVEIAEMLSPQDFVAYLNQMLDAFVAGSVPLDVLETAIPGRHTKYGFLAFNYDAPAVQAFYDKAQKMLPASSSIQSSISDGKAGKLKKTAIMNREMSRMPMPELMTDTGQVTRPAHGNLAGAPSPTPKNAPTAKPTPTPSEETASSTPWSIIVVLIVAACGLLWLLLKRRS